MVVKNALDNRVQLVIRKALDNRWSSGRLQIIGGH